MSGMGTTSLRAGRIAATARLGAVRHWQGPKAVSFPEVVSLAALSQTLDDCRMAPKKQHRHCCLNVYLCHRHTLPAPPPHLHEIAFTLYTKRRGAASSRWAAPAAPPSTAKPTAAGRPGGHAHATGGHATLTHRRSPPPSPRPCSGNGPAPLKLTARGAVQSTHTAARSPPPRSPNPRRRRWRRRRLTPNSTGPRRTPWRQ